MAIYEYQKGVESIVSSFCSPTDSQLPQLRIQPNQSFFLREGILAIGRRDGHVYIIVYIHIYNNYVTTYMYIYIFIYI